MHVYVLNRHGKPLMPCHPAKARRLLKEGKARVIRRDPFQIQLLHGSSGHCQEVVAGMDAGTQTIGCAAVANGVVPYQAEITLRQDISDKLIKRAAYRRNRRSRKTRHRPARFQNRASMRKADRLAPSVRSKVESHLREKRFVESILPISQWKVELASFDLHKIVNPDVAGKDYQEGALKGYYNARAYVLARDGHACQSPLRVKHHPRLNVHHVRFRAHGGGDGPANLVTLCETCHQALHAGAFQIDPPKAATKHPTEMGMVKAALARSGWAFTPAFGYETKYKREQFLKQEKSHAADAVAICLQDEQTVPPASHTVFKRHVAKGDYQQTRGSRSEKRIPTGKVFGLRKFDLIKTPAGIGFVKGKRSSGYFALATLSGTTLHPCVNARAATRLAARSTTLIQTTQTQPATPA